MKKILLISDSHSYLGEDVLKYTSDCDEIWHAGDIGNISVLEQLSAIKPLKAVWGNIDGYELRQALPKDLVFYSEQVKVYITHIGGYPGKYVKDAKLIIEKEKPKLFICGHSHILKVIHDPSLQLLHINPGAIGKEGFHKVRTLILFNIESDQIKDLKVVELGRR
jgi:uncharacterized protein